ncbi:MAG: hypothetical protein Q9169_008769, partial [Polycauliona sp. 2 TL-2023]
SIELGSQYVHDVKNNEPDTLDYGMIFDAEEAKLIIYGVFKDAAALAFHEDTEYADELSDIVKKEHLLLNEDKVHLLTPIAGFEREKSCD